MFERTPSSTSGLKQPALDAGEREALENALGEAYDSGFALAEGNWHEGTPWHIWARERRDREIADALDGYGAVLALTRPSPAPSEDSASSTNGAAVAPTPAIPASDPKLTGAADQTPSPTVYTSIGADPRMPRCATSDTAGLSGGDAVGRHGLCPFCQRDAMLSDYGGEYDECARCGGDAARQRALATPPIPAPGEAIPTTSTGSSGEVESVLDVIDELYRKYGTELDAEDTAIVQAARSATLAATSTSGLTDSGEVVEIVSAATSVLAAMDKYNEQNGTFLGGAPFFRLGRAIGRLAQRSR